MSSFQYYSANNRDVVVKVLIVEDNVFVGMHLEDALWRLGHEVIGPVKTVEEAIALISNGDVEFSLVDVELEESLATDVAQELCDRSIPFIYVTGCDERLVRATMPEGPILSKPVSMARLRKVLQPGQRDDARKAPARNYEIEPL
ncbi:MAG: hypothetical protein WD767_03920 [Alphaproteobacteria bacterium]